MRTPTLQYLYLQKPVTMIVIICMISVLPWIALSDFSTKGEPREAAVAISMLESGNWILPQVYADEFAYKPPMAHWLMAAFSYPQGYVSEFTSRLPSALAFIVLMGFSLFFFGERIKFQEAFIAILLLLTCIEMHRAGMTTRVDMLLTTFIVIALYQMYRWENKLELKGLPVGIPILLGCAVLTKGPVGLILPLFVFAVYLLILNKHSILTVFKSLLYIGISSLFLPLLWYVAAWKQGGNEFLDLVLAENFGRFFHLDTSAMRYELGHENGVWYNFATLFTGFLPWSIFFVFSIFGIKLKKPAHSFKKILSDLWDRIRSMEKIKLFSLVALICIIFFYSIPSSKRSVYLMPAYPFIALFLTEYAIYLTEYRTLVTRIFAALLALVNIIVLSVIILTHTGVISIVEIVSEYTENLYTLQTAELIEKSFLNNSWITFIILCFNLLALVTVLYQMGKKINIKILYSTIFLVFTINLLIDGVIMRSIREGGSSRPFADEIRQEYPLDESGIFVVNNLREYANLYGLNFYLGNRFHNFEQAGSQEGYFLCRERDYEKIMNKFREEYTFRTLKTSDYIISDIADKAVLSYFIHR